MTLKHTPGPWASDGVVVYSVPVDRVEVFKPKDGAEFEHHHGIVALVYGHVITGDEPLTHYPMEANARLIAAAPMLLAALEAILDRFEAQEAVGISVDEYERARDAVRMARGEQP